MWSRVFDFTTDNVYDKHTIKSVDTESLIQQFDYNMEFDWRRLSFIESRPHQVSIGFEVPLPSQKSHAKSHLANTILGAHSMLGVFFLL